MAVAGTIIYQYYKLIYILWPIVINGKRSVISQNYCLSLSVFELCSKFCNIKTVELIKILHTKDTIDIRYIVSATQEVEDCIVFCIEQLDLVRVKEELLEAMYRFIEVSGFSTVHSVLARKC
ncbi:5559_t:CDS:2 [Funneliformis caledonium]|uniref:5559_t:CDS:1 n=1 Tax=Funneliformis caledonium TaxID=1117310 RepID=A0A9N9E5C7_9GLOM|nr:5559_t:CDS:2 [Funneliformis caledonium]